MPAVLRLNYYQDERGGCFEIFFIAAVLLVFVILMARLVLGLVPHGFW